MTFALAWPADAPATAHGPLLVGFSGGLDSTTLLHRLAHDRAWRAHGLSAIHVHHGLHAGADAWAAHCARVCARLEVPLEIVHVRVDHDSGEGLEAAARRARHAAFAAGLGSGGILVLAHHRDDQAETFLLRALRASGVGGLASMRAWRRFGGGWLWRPLLDLPRRALHEYARLHALDWIEDPSNRDESHDRNFLRRQVMPALQARWPHADAAFARAADLQREASTLLGEADAQALAAARCVDPCCLRVTALAALPAARTARVLRRWVDGNGLPPLPAEGVAQVMGRLLAPAPADAAAFAWHGAVIRRWRDLLWAGRVMPGAPDALRIPWDGAAPLAWPGGGELVLASASPRIASSMPGDNATTDPPAPPFVAHARTGGERITLPGRRHSHALKHVLQDLGVPPWIRARMPLLSDRDGTLLAAADLVHSARFDAWLRASGRRLVWTGSSKA
ncbi:tRNA lysidine(34) synthetase TilS [Luteimonas viscosa]|uniref:tRNA(Ile)-lysidine synthase n=1 Tax=Luteimonas viscosa TaxID=1132694 RepID=A0A5D4XRN0_9GAMM|nr:tRNA lysidine(34) synthetase TilS [Luteimonas viscosa]TYT27367.1 tRNA lysidine(34) synthetase TilS [Luteimonas viscosa]